MDSQVGQSLDGLSFSLYSTLCPCISFRQEQFWVKNLKSVRGPITQLGAVPNLWIWSLQIPSPLCWIFQLMSSLLSPGSLLLSWHLGLSVGYPQFPIPHCYTPLFNFLTLCTSPQSPPIPDPSPFFLSPSLIPPKSLSPSTSHDYFVPPSE